MSDETTVCVAIRAAQFEDEQDRVAAVCASREAAQHWVIENAPEWDRDSYEYEELPLVGMEFVGFMGKSTRMIFPTASRSNPDAYVPVWAFEPVPEDK